jgi:uncharacterized protein (DUF3820 family)
MNNEIEQKKLDDKTIYKTEAFAAFEKYINDPRSRNDQAFQCLAKLAKWIFSDFQLSNEAIMPWGKYTGTHVKNLPLEYVNWLHESGALNRTENFILKSAIEKYHTKTAEQNWVTIKEFVSQYAVGDPTTISKILFRNSHEEFIKRNGAIWMVLPEELLIFIANSDAYPVMKVKAEKICLTKKLKEIDGKKD